MDNTWIGDHLGTPGAASMGLDPDAAQRQAGRVDLPGPHWWLQTKVFFHLLFATRFPPTSPPT